MCPSDEAFEEFTTFDQRYAWVFNEAPAQSVLLGAFAQHPASNRRGYAGFNQAGNERIIGTQGVDSKMVG